MLCNKEDLDILVEILNSSNNDNIKAVRADINDYLTLVVIAGKT
jgi:hypothetical protein